MNAEGSIVLHAGNAVWIGDSLDGEGYVSTESGALHGNLYAADRHIKNAYGTNPEELIAAAHASSFTIHLSRLLTEAGFIVDRMDTTALLKLENDQHGSCFSHIHLVLTASVPCADNSTFQSLANGAKENCAVSKLLNTKITLSAQLAKQQGMADECDWRSRTAH